MNDSESFPDMGMTQMEIETGSEEKRGHGARQEKKKIEERRRPVLMNRYLMRNPVPL
jgi:hypothetical protein